MERSSPDQAGAGWRGRIATSRAFGLPIRTVARALQIGVQAAFPVDAQKRIRLSNLLALWAVAIMTPWFAVEALFGSPGMLPLEAGFLIGFAAVLALNAAAAHRAARILLVVMANVCVFAGAAMFDRSTGGVFPFVGLVGLPLLLFGPEERSIVGLGVALPMLLFVAAETGLAGRALGIDPQPAPPWYFAANVLSAFVVAFVIPFFFYRSNLRAERQLEEIAQEKLRRSQEALRLRDLFSSIASHELKTPLTVLMLNFKMLRRRLESMESLPTSVGPQVERCQSAAVRMGELINRLLDVAQMHDGRLNLRRNRIDVVEAVRRVSGGFEVNRTVGQQSSIHVEAEGSVTAALDALRFEQIVTNLLSNAIKYGDGKPIEVRIRRDETANAAHLEVIDHGPGIAPDMTQKIFEPFRRAVAGGDPIPGLGLGLYVVKMIVDGHGGKVDVQSRPGQGARFIVDLPCAG
jgi:signal transduction histidine kinase